jgi:hypothetical protein
MKSLRHSEIEDTVIIVPDDAVQFYVASGWQELSDEEVEDRAEEARQSLLAIDQGMAEQAAAGQEPPPAPEEDVTEPEPPKEEES